MGESISDTRGLEGLVIAESNDKVYSKYMYFFYSRFGSKTDVPNGENEKEIWRRLKQDLVPSSQA